MPEFDASDAWMRLGSCLRVDDALTLHLGQALPARYPHNNTAGARGLSWRFLATPIEGLALARNHADDPYRRIKTTCPGLFRDLTGIRLIVGMLFVAT
jgi:hypothetical protein